MTCFEVKPLLDAYADGELDPAHHLQIEGHLNECSGCAAMHQNISALRSAFADNSLYFRAPSGLQERVAASLGSSDTKTSPRRSWLNWRWSPALVPLAVIVLVLVTVLAVWWPRATENDLLASEMVSAHVRSLMVDHLTDVPSSDQHTVKPWFEGKLDFSPPVVDLGPQGFTLVGGRLDYISGRTVAALVYQRRQHVINLFIFPTADEPNSGTDRLTRQGFNLIAWKKSGMTFWAVSDLNTDELQQFSQLLGN